MKKDSAPVVVSLLVAGSVALTVAVTWVLRAPPASDAGCAISEDYATTFHDEGLLSMEPDGDRLQLELVTPGEEMYVTFNYSPTEVNDMPLQMYKVPVRVRASGPGGSLGREPIDTTTLVAPSFYRKMVNGKLPLTYCVQAPTRVSSDPTQLRTLLFDAWQVHPAHDTSPLPSWGDTL